MPLPRHLTHLLITSTVLSTTAAILSLTHSFGVDSLYTIPSAWAFTLAYHITLYILSRRRAGPPPLPHPDDTSPISIKNGSRASVYHPAGSKKSEEGGGVSVNNIQVATAFDSTPAITIHDYDLDQGQEPYRNPEWSDENTPSSASAASATKRTGGGPPSFSDSAGTGNGSGAPKYPSFTLTNANCIATGFLAVLWTVGAVLSLRQLSILSLRGEEPLPMAYTRTLAPIPEVGIMWALVVLFLRARKRRRRAGEFVRMDNC